MGTDLKLSAVVVTYYPDLSVAINNIEQYIDFVDNLIIWENTPIIDRGLHRILIPKYADKIIYLGTDKNEGMAYALNRSVEWSVTNKYTHILTMDQDSHWANFEHYKQQIEKYSVDKTIGIFGPNVLTTGEARVFSELQIVEYIITSGAIYDLDMLSKIGMFREDFFIDGVDVELCLWAARNDYKTVMLGDCYLKQKYGDSTIHQLFNKSFTTYNYSSFRLFRIVKNHIVLWKEYPELSKSLKKVILTEYTFFRMIKIIFFETNKISKISSILKGISSAFFCTNKSPRKKIIVKMKDEKNKLL